MCGGEDEEIKGNALPEGPEVDFVGHASLRTLGVLAGGVRATKFPARPRQHLRGERRHIPSINGG